MLIDRNMSSMMWQSTLLKVFLKSSKERTLRFPSSIPRLMSSVKLINALTVLWPARNLDWKELRRWFLLSNESNWVWTRRSKTFERKGNMEIRRYSEEDLVLFFLGSGILNACFQISGNVLEKREQLLNMLRLTQSLPASNSVGSYGFDIFGNIKIS